MISVIVPVYNSAVTLRRCVDSILMQGDADFELILVDDGSTDGSAVICDEYEVADGRVRVVHKQNGGVSSARNEGLRIAGGEWLTFVDSDDYLGPHFFEHVDGCTEDLLVRGCMFFNEQGTFLNHNILDGWWSQPSLQDFIQRYLQSPTLRGPVGKFYRRQLIGDLRFHEDMKVGEDSCFVFSYLERCSSYRILYYYYYYVITDISAEVKYGMTAQYAGRSLTHLMDAFKELDETHNIGRECFLSFYSYFKMVSRNDWRKNPIRWFGNKDVRAVYEYMWDVLPMFQRLQYRFMQVFAFWGE